MRFGHARKTPTSVGGDFLENRNLTASSPVIHNGSLSVYASFCQNRWVLSNPPDRHGIASIYGIASIIVKLSAAG